MTWKRSAIALALLLVLSNVAWYQHTRTLARDVEYEHRYAQKYLATANKLYYENEANDHAATECAVKTGWKYNCADGTQAASCEPEKVTPELRKQELEWENSDDAPWINEDEDTAHRTQDSI
jgi:hypothetical protein